MDDMNAFERQLAAKVVRMAGPDPHFNALEIARIAATQSHKWSFGSMFSATKFVVAGAIVALFGGFLLAGVLTQPSDEAVPVVAASAPATAKAEPTVAATIAPEPTTTGEVDVSTRDPELLPGVELFTQEVEPGVYRVINDGLRVPPGIFPKDGLQTHALVRHIVPTQDGDVWVFPWGAFPGPTKFFALGSEYHDWSEVNGVQPFDVGVAPDGRLWFARDGSEGKPAFGSFDGDDGWLRHSRASQGRGAAAQVEVLADGTVVGAWVDDANDTRVGIFEGDRSWRELDPVLSDDGDSPDELFASDDGDIWLRSGDHLYRWTGGHWRQVSYPGGLLDHLDIGPDGTIWADLWTEEHGENTLARMDDAGWMSSDMAGIAKLDDWAILPSSVEDERFERNGVFEVGPDGALWFSPAGARDATGVYSCDGIARFDGAVLARFLRGYCIVALGVAPDGHAWLQAMDRLRGGDSRYLYVITPEAVAAST